MKTLLVALPVLCLVSQSCTIVDYKDAKGKARKVEQLVKLGDNIRTARSRLVTNGFNPSEIHYGTVSKTSYYFTLSLTKITELDAIGYAFDVNLNPWRNGVPRNMVFESGLDEKIYEIETN